MEDAQAERIIKIFEEAGFRIELGATFSAKGQIAQLLNACNKLIDTTAIIAGCEAEAGMRPDGQRVADAVRQDT
jgi:hypothetical protein